MSPLPQDAAKCKALLPNWSETRAKFAQTRGKSARIFAAFSFVMADKISSACLARRHFGVQSIVDGLILNHRSYREHIATGLPKRPRNAKWFTLIKTPPFWIDTYRLKTWFAGSFVEIMRQHLIGHLFVMMLIDQSQALLVYW